MIHDTARFILQQMLDGVDPTTGEFLPEDHFCHDPTVIRALHTAIMALMGPEEQSAPEAPFTADGTDGQYLTKRGRLRADRPWTEEDCETLAQLYRAGLSPESIAPQIHRRRRGVERQLRYLGLMFSEESSADEVQPGLERAGKPWTQEEHEKLKKMYQAKLPVKTMAVELQRTPYAVFCRMERLGYCGDEQGYPPIDGVSAWPNANNAALRQMFKEGASTADMAAHFGCGEASISARLFYLGLTKDSPISLRN